MARSMQRFNGVAPRVSAYIVGECRASSEISEHNAGMPCLIGCLALAFPRVAVFLVWLFGGNYLTRAFDSILWPLIGFLFFPLTTLAFAYGMNSIGNPGEMEPFGWLLVLIAFVTDIGLIGNGGRTAAQQRERGRFRSDA